MRIATWYKKYKEGYRPTPSARRKTLNHQEISELQRIFEHKERLHGTKRETRSITPEFVELLP